MENHCSKEPPMLHGKQTLVMVKLEGIIYRMTDLRLATYNDLGIHYVSNNQQCATNDQQ